MITSARFSIGSLIARLLRSERGVSAVEFSLLAPFLVVGGLSTVDAGMAIYDKMMISQVLRAGAHGAISAESGAVVLSILEATASDNFTVASGGANPGELSVAVSSYCICPEDTASQVACTANCSAGNPNQFYRLTATQEFTAIMLPDFTLSGSIDVIAR